MPTNEKVYIDLQANSQSLKAELKAARDAVKDLASKMLELENTNKKSTQTYQNLDSRLNQARTSVTQLSRAQRGLTTEAKRSMYQIMEFAENLTTVLFGAGYAFGKMFEKGKDVVMTAARVETLGVVVTQLGKNVGKSESEMKAYVEGVKQMGITSEAAATNISRLIQADIKLDYAQNLARISQDAAVIGMTNSSEAMENMIHAITTLQPKVLKQYGISLDLNEVYKEYKKELGGVTRELTTAEKKQAFLNAILEKGKTIAGTYEAAMETAGKKVLSFERYTEEAKVALGDHFLPVANTSIDIMTDLTKAFIGTEKPLQVLIGSVGLLGTSITQLIPLISGMKLAFGSAFVATIGYAGAALAGMAAFVKASIDNIRVLITLFESLPGIMTDARKIGELPEKIVQGDGKEQSLGDLGVLQKLQLKYKLGIDAINDTKQTTIEKEAKTLELRKKLEEVNKKIEKTGGTSRGGDSPQVEDAKEELNLVTLNLAEQEKIKNQILENSENTGALIDLHSQLNELIREENRLRTGINERMQMQVDMGSQIFELNKKSKESTAFSLGLENLAIDVQKLPEWIEPMSPMMDAVNNSVVALGGSLSSLFQGMVSGSQTALEGLKNSFKAIVNTFITSVQAMIFAAGGAAWAKGITSFGISLITDLPWLALAWAGLEAAKGVIGGLAEGGQAVAGTPYIVGEKGQELFIPNQSGQVLSNKDTMKLLSGIGGSNPVVNNYFSVESDFINVMEKNMPIYNQRKYAKR